MTNRQLEHHEIVKYMPYRWPWLLIDRVLDWTPEQQIITQKVVSASDPLIAGHFAEGPRVIPGVLLIELIGQSAYLLMRLSNPLNTKQPHLLVRSQASFLAPALAGDVLVVNVNLSDNVQGVAIHQGIISVEDRKICRVKIMSKPQPRDESEVEI